MTAFRSIPFLISSFCVQSMKDVFANKIPVWQKEQKEIKTLYGDKILGTCTVEQAYGGMRSVKSMVYETSLLDPVEVIQPFHMQCIDSAVCTARRVRGVHRDRCLTMTAGRVSVSEGTRSQNAKRFCRKLR